MLSRQAIRSIRAAAPARTIARAPARSYAAAAPSAAAANQDVKPPVAVYGIDGTYATALYTAAVKSSALEPTARALSALGDLYSKDAKLATILATPTLTDADKSAVVAELQKQIGGAANETVKSFLATLAENNRLGILKGVAEKFHEIISASRGEVELVVTSAQQLDNKTLNRLESAIAKSQYSQGKKLKVRNEVNPDILGGLVVEIGDRTIDLSVSSKIAKLNKLLTDTL
ncbi:ATP synthase F0 subcomplex subunit OSCP atp5 [Diatrype stigma]|uniref:ATP synthase subunit 5, mitochondrial n=1 Tax=Diatrype stigma TaxID=117547 RepID=A0AAN9YPF3_9PEZI